MKRWVYAHQAVAGDPVKLDELLRTRLDWLIRSATHSPEARREADGGLRVPLDPSLPGVPAKAVHLTTGVATHEGARLHIPIAWHARPGDHAFPAFEGRLGLEPLSHEAAKLTILGSYGPPASVVGAAADATLLRGVAQRTVDSLVSALAEELGRAQERPPTLELPEPLYAPMRVADVMTTDPLVVNEDLPVRTAALLLLHHEISGAPVVDIEGELIGVVSEADLLLKETPPPQGLGHDAAVTRRRWAAVTVGEICSRPALVTAPDVSVHDAALHMREKGISRLVVIAESRIAGIVTRHDVLKALARTDLELQLVVEQLLAARQEPDVRATVDAGVVRLEGMVRKLSRREALVRAVRALDGVITVESDGLNWLKDDITPMYYPRHWL